jgi:ADP-heptose:LPS heptosyltransferase
MDKIAVIRLSSLGDLILTEPVIANLKHNFPESEISFFTRQEYSDLVEMIASVDRIVAFEYEHKHAQKSSVREKLGSINTTYDLAMDIHKVNRSRFVLKNLKANKKVTYNKNGLYRLWAVITKNKQIETHTLDRYLAPLEKLELNIDTRIPALVIPESAVARADQIISKNELEKNNFIVLAVGASHPTKHYPIPQFVELARMINKKYNKKILVVEKQHFEYLNLFEDLVKSKVLMLGIGYDIQTLAALLSAAELTVSNDSGVMHLSAASGTPTFGLFGPTHPVLGFSPLGKNCHAMTVNQSCSPCSLHGQRLCYRDEQYCFTKLTSELIIDKIDYLLGAS